MFFLLNSVTIFLDLRLYLRTGSLILYNRLLCKGNCILTNLVVVNFSTHASVYMHQILSRKCLDKTISSNFPLITRLLPLRCHLPDILPLDPPSITLQNPSDRLDADPKAFTKSRSGILDGVLSMQVLDTLHGRSGETFRRCPS